MVDVSNIIILDMVNLEGTAKKLKAFYKLESEITVKWFIDVHVIFLIHKGQKIRKRFRQWHSLATLFHRGRYVLESWGRRHCGKAEQRVADKRRNH